MSRHLQVCVGKNLAQMEVSIQEWVDFTVLKNRMLEELGRE